MARRDYAGASPAELASGSPSPAGAAPGRRRPAGRRPRAVSLAAAGHGRAVAAPARRRAAQRHVRDDRARPDRRGRRAHARLCPRPTAAPASSRSRSACVPPTHRRSRTPASRAASRSSRGATCGLGELRAGRRAGHRLLRAGSPEARRPGRGRRVVHYALDGRTDGLVRPVQPFDRAPLRGAREPRRRRGRRARRPAPSGAPQRPLDHRPGRRGRRPLPHRAGRASWSPTRRRSRSPSTPTRPGTAVPHEVWVGTPPAAASAGPRRRCGGRRSPTWRSSRGPRSTPSRIAPAGPRHPGRARGRRRPRRSCWPRPGSC